MGLRKEDRDKTMFFEQVDLKPLICSLRTLENCLLLLLRLQKASQSSHRLRSALNFLHARS